MNHRGVEAGRRIWMAIRALALLAFAVEAASAQERNDDLEQIARLFGAQTKAVAFVEKLGGKVVYYEDRPEKVVKKVDLSHSKIADQDLVTFKALLKYLPELQTLDLSDTAMTDAGLAHLKESLGNLPKTVSLNISGTKVTDAGLGHLRGTTGLYDLALADTQVTDAGVSGFRQTVRDLRISRKPRALRYFPGGVLGPGRDDFLANWYSEDLYAMKEPSLWSLSKEDRQAVVYRFFWAPSFERPIVVRVVLLDQGATLHAVQFDAHSGYFGAKPAVRKSVTLTRDQWTELKRRVDEARFWSMPTVCWTNGIADGAAYVFEGVSEGKYHVVNANSNPHPDERFRRYKALCEAMVKLSGLDVMDLWKRY
jgi:hypothetical protein